MSNGFCRVVQPTQYLLQASFGYKDFGVNFYFIAKTTIAKNIYINHFPTVPFYKTGWNLINRDIIENK